MMGGHIAPLVHLSEMDEARRIRGVGGRQIENKAETLEIFPQIVGIGIAMIECRLALNWAWINSRRLGRIFETTIMAHSV
ncbi:MAG: hypothetical protein HY040_16290 [Planctomycetes bacterium]|nr:hypothetical protein [Planctomycetota bacterium]